MLLPNQNINMERVQVLDVVYDKKERLVTVSPREILYNAK
jgi:hypothetical protein